MNFPPSKIFLIICLAFMAGVAAGEAVSAVASLSILAGLIIVATLIPSKNVLVITAAMVCFLAGSLRLQSLDSANHLGEYYGQTLEVSGQIIEEPDIRSDKILLTLGHLAIGGRPVPGKIILYAERYPEYEYGSQLTFKGKITEPDESPEFSYKNYLSRFGIFAVVYRPKVSYVELKKGNVIKYYSLRAKKVFNSGLDKILPEPEDGFLKGILTGQKAALPQTITDEFNATGTSHIIAVSGFNITIIITAMAAVFNRFGRRVSFILSMLLIFLFVILTGASASVVRAAIMGLTAQIALNTGRLYYVTNALVLAGVIMLIQNPKLLRFDVGFQLSFLALMGLVYITPIFEKVFPKAPSVLKSFLFPTLSAQIISTPFILLTFGRLSLVAPITNLLVLPWVPMVMGLGFASGAASLIFQPAAKLIGWVTWLILHFMLLAIRVSAGLPLASVSIDHVPVLALVLFYSVLCLLLIAYYHPKIKERLWTTLLKK